MQDRRPAIPPLELRRKRLQQPGEHERERLEALDGPVEIDRLLETLLRCGRHERLLILSARDPLPLDAGLPEPHRHFIRRQGRKVAERSEAPPAQRAGWWLVVSG